MVLTCTHLALAQKGMTKVRISGIVTDSVGNPIKDALIFIDKAKSTEKTNKKGAYALKISSETNLISAYVPNLGILSTVFEGQETIDFNFKSELEPITDEMMHQLGFDLNPSSKLKNNYSDFGSILEILERQFSNVRVKDGEIKIGRGPNVFNSLREPLILVDNRQVKLSELDNIATTDVKSIRVISSGSEASQYGGLQGANGVILINLKKD